MSKNSVKSEQDERDTELPAELPSREGDQEEAEMTQLQLEQGQQIVESGTVTPTKGKYTIHCLTIVGQIEGHYILSPQNKTTKYEHVIPQLVSIQENPDIEGLIIILNTVGGDVEAGLAIAELVSGMRKPSVSLVLGGGHSIGVPLAVSANKSFIAPSATMTIHPVRMNGTVLGVPQTLSYFEKMQERITGFVEENSNMSPKRFRQMMMNTGELVMDVGTVITGKQAVEVGLIDYVGGLSDAIECLYSLIEEYKASHQEGDDDSAVQPVTSPNDSPVPIQYVKRNGEKEYSREKKRRRTAARVRRGAAAQYSGNHSAPQTEMDTGKQRYVSGSARGAERQNKPPQADFPLHNQAGTGHTINGKNDPGQKQKDNVDTEASAQKSNGSQRPGGK